MKAEDAGKRPTHDRQFTPAIGPDAGTVAYVRAQTERETSQTRDRIAYIFLAGIAVALVAAGAYGAYHDDFAALGHVWFVAGPFAGWIAARYFGRKDSG